MSNQISEEAPVKEKEAPAAAEGGVEQGSEKKIRQAVYDIRYRARREELDLRHAFSQYLGNSNLNQQEKTAVQEKLFGKEGGGAPAEQAEALAIDSIANAMHKVFNESASDQKYKVRVKDKEKAAYVRYADRAKINQLRANPQISSVEMTGHGDPYEGDKDKKPTTSSIQKKPSKSGKKDEVSGKDKKIDLKKEEVEVTKEGYGKIKTPEKVVGKVRQPKKVDIPKGSKVKEEYLADGAAVAPPKNKKITGEKVDNSKLIKVFPQDQSDPQIGNIKSSYKPVGQVVSEILAKEDMNKGYVVTAADKKGNTPAWQGYKAGKKKKDGTPLYRPADHLKNEGVEVKVEGDDDTSATVDALLDTINSKNNEDSRAMYTKWNLAKNKLRAAGLKMSYEPEGEMVEGYQRDPEQQEKERKTSKQTDPSKPGFTGISDDIGEIMRQNAAMKKAAAKKTKKEGYTNVVEDIADILARLEKKRISKGGDPDESPLGKKTGRAMKSQQDKARKKAGLKVEHHEKDADGNVIPHEEIDEGIGRTIKKVKRIANRVKNSFDDDPGRAHTIGTLGNPNVRNEDERARQRKDNFKKKVKKTLGLKSEEVVNELKTSTLRNYANKAAIDAVGRGVDAGIKGMVGTKDEMEKNMTKAYKRQRGISRAVNKLAGRAQKAEKKEEFDPSVQSALSVLDSYMESDAKLHGSVIAKKN